MELPIVDSEEIPVPPEKVRIRSLVATLYPDGRRMRVELKLSPFQTSPAIDILAKDDSGKELASTSIIGSDNSDMLLTMHLRTEDIPPQIILQAVVHYPDIGAVDQRDVHVPIPPEPDREGE
jgi:hypothetical protein